MGYLEPRTHVPHQGSANSHLKCIANWLFVVSVFTCILVLKNVFTYLNVDNLMLKRTSLIYYRFKSFKKKLSNFAQCEQFNILTLELA